MMLYFPLSFVKEDFIHVAWRLIDWICRCFSVSSIFTVPTVKLQPESGDSIQVCSKTNSHGKGTSNSKHWPGRAARRDPNRYDTQCFGRSYVSTVSGYVWNGTSMLFIAYCKVFSAYNWLKTVCNQHLNRCLQHSCYVTLQIAFFFVCQS